jgi:hypothetical protein
MADQLTSVRLDRDTVTALRMLADLNDTSVAAEIREAVRRYIEETTSAPDFDKRLEEAERNRRALVETVLTASRQKK